MHMLWYFPRRHGGGGLVGVHAAVVLCLQRLETTRAHTFSTIIQAANLRACRRMKTLSHIYKACCSFNSRSWNSGVSRGGECCHYLIVSHVLCLDQPIRMRSYIYKPICEWIENANSQKVKLQIFKSLWVQRIHQHRFDQMQSAIITS